MPSPLRAEYCQCASFHTKIGVHGLASSPAPYSYYRGTTHESYAAIAGWQRCYVVLDTPRAGLSGKAGFQRLVRFRCFRMAPFSGLWLLPKRSRQLFVSIIRCLHTLCSSHFRHLHHMLRTLSDLLLSLFAFFVTIFRYGTCTQEFHSSAHNLEVYTQL
jgi:hypothetical protein